ncbi:carbohydrate ABC transporter permease [Cnuibacter physcomitrellae]|uniref:carbohydrate ABC transporter permease n=1 Tax=Cnuibacter physcomitrellae TaxID=1619308 RepID=UPI002175B669|nr:carbohydrate ABC transporter permease [Cnuibacter physcomitrellae]MCS5498369.1 carbohydrate ABC transporter permease [Cnuibacter physcomitrellae]
MLETRSRGAVWVLQLIATVIIIPFLFPLVVMVQGSFGGRGWGNYEAVLAIPDLWRYFLNSTIIALAVIAIVFVCTLLAAFAFSKLRVPAKELFFWLLLLGLTLPEIVLITPLFATAAATGLYDTLWAVIIPTAALQIPFTVLIVRSFFDGIPNELFEAARVDGASTVRMFWSIVLPLSRPIAATVVILTLITSWNAYLLPLVFLQSADNQTVTLLSQFFVGQFVNDQTKILAGSVIIALPEILAYVLLQRYFEKGLTAGAVK